MGGRLPPDWRDRLRVVKGDDEISKLEDQDEPPQCGRAALIVLLCGLGGWGLVYAIGWLVHRVWRW